MKKIILIFTILFVSCFDIQVKPKEITAQSVYATHLSYQFQEVQISGMRYGIWICDYRSGAEGAIAVVNITKDQLEVELLKKQLKDVKDTPNR